MVDPIIGLVTTKVNVKVRQGAPSVQASVLRTLEAGTVVEVTGKVTGDRVLGVADWYSLPDNEFIWSGGAGSFVAAEEQAPAGASLVSPSPMVIDLYDGDQVRSFGDAKAAGLLGVIHKATTGGTGRDDKYAERRKMAADAGLLWGAYHWGTAAPIDDQVENFLGWAAPDDNTLIAVDFESDAGNQMTLQGLRAFSDGVFARKQRRPVIYGGILLKTTLGGAPDPYFAAHRLWLAQYGPKPVTQASWPRFWLWQYTDGSDRTPLVTVPGVPGNARGQLDCNYFDGSATDLIAQWAT